MQSDLRKTNRHPERPTSADDVAHVRPSSPIELGRRPNRATDRVDELDLRHQAGIAGLATGELPVTDVLDIADMADGSGLPDPAPLRRRLIKLDIGVITVVWLGLGLVSRSPTDPGRLGSLLLETAVVIAVTLFSLGRLGLYRARICASPRIVRRRLVAVAALAVGTSWVVDPNRDAQTVQVRLITCGIVLYVALVVGREIFEQWLRASRARGRFQRSVLVVGTMSEVEQVVDLLDAHPEAGLRAVAWMGDYDGPSSEPTMTSVPWVGTIGDVVGGVALTSAMSVLVGPSVAASPELKPIVRRLHADRVHVQLWTGLWNVDHRRLHASPIAHEPFYYLEPTGTETAKLWAKRMLDVILSSIVLVLASPVILGTAIAIKLDDGGPVFFRQERVGLGGRRFRIRKFRTMSVDAEARLAELQEQNERNGPLFKLERDPRVTRVGRILRFTSVDELPQLIDVLAGHLSLVGPRPALPDEVAEFDDELRERHRVVPGVTGLWQVEARHNPSFYAYRHLDLFYVDNWTLGLDMVILLATAKTVLSDGAHELWAMVDRHRKAST
jgi:exopolysaccharide biosynthesis polyprenyl glycosylphosphotransferase